MGREGSQGKYDIVDEGSSWCCCFVRCDRDGKGSGDGRRKCLKDAVYGY